MTDLARLHFRSSVSPQQHGVMVLAEDGTFRIEPSEDFRDELAGLEEKLLAKTNLYGITLGSALLVLGALMIGGGWFIGRKAGKLGTTLRRRRQADDVQAHLSPNGGLRLRLRGQRPYLSSLQLEWTTSEIAPEQAASFVTALRELQRKR